MTVNFQNQLGVWPNDIGSQIIWVDKLKALLQQMDTELAETAHFVVELQQATEPSQAEWEAAWLFQTGRPLPISKAADLIWWDTSEDYIGGLYGVLLDSTTVQRKDPKNPRNSVALYQIDSEVDAQSITANIGADNTPYPSIDFTNSQPLRLELEFQMFVDLASGTGVFGADFLVDGVKVGSSYYGVSTDQGIICMNASGFLRVVADIPEVAPGSHTVQVIFGVCGVNPTPPTLDIGGLSAAGGFGARQLIVKGYPV
jgi:hypothetical protein